MDNTGSGEQKPVLEQQYGESLFTKKYRFRIYKTKIIQIEIYVEAY